MEVDAKVVEEKLEEKEVEDEEEEAEEENNCDKIQQPSPGRWGNRDQKKTNRAQKTNKDQQKTKRERKEGRGRKEGRKEPKWWVLLRHTRHITRHAGE